MTWPTLLQLSLTEHLETLRLLKLESASRPEEAAQETYVSFMIAFFRLDLERMKLILAKSEQSDSMTPEWLKRLFQLRVMIREDVQPEPLRQFEKTFNELPTEDYQRGEILYSLGVAYHALKLYSEAEDRFLQASALLEKAGADKKSLRALMSSLASYSCVNPQSRLFFEYSTLCRKALRISDYQTAGTCLVNISREYQRLNLLQAALEVIEEAGRLFEEHALGSREHALAIVQRAHLLFQLKRTREATRELEVATMNRHPEVQSAVRCLAEMFQVEDRAENSNQILPTWQERQEEEPEKKSLGRLETLVMELISQSPKTRNELVEKVYGSSIESDYTHARIKNILARIRKRFPGLIYFDGEKYFVTDQETEALKTLRRRIGDS